MLALLVLIAFVPLNALITTATVGKLWEWFVSPQYGAGPTSATWYGVSLIFGLFVSSATYSVKRETGEGWAMLLPSIGHWIGCALLLVCAWFAGNIIGWL